MSRQFPSREELGGALRLGVLLILFAAVARRARREGVQGGDLGGVLARRIVR